MYIEVANSSNRTTEIKEMRILYEEDINKRYELFEARFLKKASEFKLTKEEYFPTTLLKSIINDRVALCPSRVIVSETDNNDFITEYLLKETINPLLNDILIEIELAGDAFFLVQHHFSDKVGVLYNLSLQPLKAENVKVIMDLSTLSPRAFEVKFEKLVDTEKGQERVTEYKRYYKDKIEVYSSGVNTTPSKVLKNPFEPYGFIPVIWIKGATERHDSYYSNIDLYKLKESQLQVDKINTDLSNAISSNSAPLLVIENSLKKEYKGMYVGARAVLALQGEAEAKMLTSSLQIDSVKGIMEKQEDEAYILAGLIQLHKKSELYRSDSAKTFMMANKALSTLIELRFRNIGIEVEKLVKLFLELNAKVYNNERILVEKEILTGDLESASLIASNLIPLNIMDAELWLELFLPHAPKATKDRIIEVFAKGKELQEKSLQADITNKLQPKSQDNKTK